MKPTLKESKIILTSIHDTIIPKTPPWIIKESAVIRELSEVSKAKTNLDTYQDKLHNIMLHYPNHFCIFINGFKNDDKRHVM